MEDKYAMAMRQCLDKTFTSFVRKGNYIGCRFWRDLMVLGIT